jgi:hypothetical protein
LLYLHEIMKNRGDHTFWTRATISFVVPLLVAVSACRLEDNKLQVKIYPENGATNVPVNTVIEIQYPNELGIRQDQMKAELFSIRQCTIDHFSYLTKQNTSGTEKSSEKTNTDESKKDDAEKNTSDDEKFPKVNFFYANNYDAEKKIIFNYLVIDPEERSSALMPSEEVPTTYCVRVKKLKNKDGVTIPQKEISFTTEETPSLDFSSKINPEFYGKRLAITQPDASSGIDERDFILVYFRDQSVGPAQLKGKIKLCLKSTNISSTSGACKEYGEETPSDIYMIEGLQNEEGLVHANYNLFAISPRIELANEQQFKLVLDKDLNPAVEVRIGTSQALIDVDEDTTLSWHQEYTAINGRNKYTPHHRFFYIGTAE